MSIVDKFLNEVSPTPAPRVVLLVIGADGQEKIRMESEPLGGSADLAKAIMEKFPMANWKGNFDQVAVPIK